jgi:hypothetical protein
MRAALVASTRLLATCSRFKHDPPRTKTYAEAIAEVERLTGSKGDPGESASGDQLDGVLLFEAQSGAAVDIVNRHQTRLAPAGAYKARSGEPHALIERYIATNREFFFWWD